MQIEEVQTENLLTARDVAELLSVKVSWVHSHVTRIAPIIPHLKLGTGKGAPVRFRRTEIETWLLDFSRKPRLRRR